LVGERLPPLLLLALLVLLLLLLLLPLPLSPLLLLLLLVLVLAVLLIVMQVVGECKLRGACLVTEGCSRGSWCPTCMAYFSTDPGWLLLLVQGQERLWLRHAGGITYFSTDSCWLLLLLLLVQGQERLWLWRTMGITYFSIDPCWLLVLLLPFQWQGQKRLGLWHIRDAQEGWMGCATAAAAAAAGVELGGGRRASEGQHAGL